MHECPSQLVHVGTRTGKLVGSHISAGALRLKPSIRVLVYVGLERSYCVQPFVLGTWYYNIHPVWKITE
jgi:hypothetical protein